MQYFAYPDWKFDRLRRATPGRYEAGADIGPDEWLRTRLVAAGERVRVHPDGVELTDVDLAVRMVSVITNIKMEQLVTGMLAYDQSQHVVAAIDRVSPSRLHIVSGPGYTSTDASACALQVQAAESARPARIVIDYVQLLKDQQGDRRVRERNVSAAARGLKDVSGELGIPVFALVQLNRKRAIRVNKRPQLADLTWIRIQR